MNLKEEKTDATEKKGMALSDDALENVTGGKEAWVIAILDENGNVTGEWTCVSFASSWEAEYQMEGIPERYRPEYMKVMTMAEYLSQRRGGDEAPVANFVTHVGPRRRGGRASY